jgi:hypothetical protein
VRHLKALLLLAAMAFVWTWPLAANLGDHIPGVGGDNYSFLWNLWWMRKALGAPELEFFHSSYLFSPFGVDLVNHPHTALQAYLSATLMPGTTVVAAENIYIITSVFLNGVCAYALLVEVAGDRRSALIGALVFGGSPYIAAHLMGHFDLLTAWVIPLFALCFRRALDGGRAVYAIAAGLSVVIAAYSAYYYVVFLALFAVTYALAAWHVVYVSHEPRQQTPVVRAVRNAVAGLLVLDVLLMVVISLSGGFSVSLFDIPVTAHNVQNPLTLMWLLGSAWVLTRRRIQVRFERPPSEAFWRGMQALTITAAVFTVLSLPLVVQAFRLVASGRYVTQTYFWRSAPRGVDVLAPLAGHPFHPLYGTASSRLYEALGLNRVEAVGWIGIVPLLVLVRGRGKWMHVEEARRWKVVLIVFALWALGPFLTVAGHDIGLPLPQTLARFVPFVDNARMPGRAMVVVYLAIAVLMALRLAVSQHRHPWLLAGLLALDYVSAPIPLTALDRPEVYERLAAIPDTGAVIEVPFGVGDGLTTGVGSQNRRLLYYATIHNHPVVGGYIGRMPPLAARAYDSMPVVGNLLRLSSGRDAVEEDPPAAVPFRYLVLDTGTASPELVDYTRSTLDMDLIASGAGKELYAVQGVRAPTLRARR